jgi:two-component system, response regulator PdtaR
LLLEDVTMRIMIVEDEPLIAMLLDDTLRHAGHEVVGIADNSTAARQLAQSMHPTVALVDVDLESKKIGIEVARELFKAGISPLYVTGQVELARQHSETAIGLLGKPFEPHDVVEAVDVLASHLRGDHPPPPTIPKNLELFVKH